MSDGAGGLRGGINKFLQDLPTLIERLQEIQTKTEEARERGEDPRPIVQSSFSGNVLGQRIGSIPPGAGGGGGGGQGSSQYGDDPKQHTDEYGAGLGRNRGAGMGAGGINKGGGKKAAPKKEEEAPIEHETVDLVLDVLDDQVVAEIPGVDEDHLTVVSADGTLAVEGTALHRTYSGSVELPADRRAGKHTLNNGVLVVKLAKARGKKAK